jgi:NodT family efflux transporter outer membrane factor (OMF) lipoprotein
VESLAAQEAGQRYALEATYVTLSTNVVLAAVQEASLRAQIAATERMVAIETEQLQIMQREVDLGAISVSDATAQEVVLAQTAALLPPLRKQLAIQRDALCALLGKLPSQEPAATFEFTGLELPLDIPVSLPSQIVEQRPDVRMAEEQMHSASADVGVAIANMLPQISIDASIGGTSTSIAHMFAAGNKFWTEGATLSQTVFAGGTLYHREQAARDALDQAGAQYRSAVIAAFQNIADSLHAVVFDAEALKANRDAEQSAQRSLDYARKAQELGSVSYLQLLNAEQAYQQAVVNRVQAQANRYADTAALFQALGGGWWNRKESEK